MGRGRPVLPAGLMPLAAETSPVLSSKSRRVSMPSDEHVKWLLEGVEAWNRRRQEDPFKPDLAHLSFRDEFQRAGRLDPDGQVRLVGICLDGARLRHADLSCAPTLWRQIEGSRPLWNGSDFRSTGKVPI